MTPVKFRCKRSGNTITMRSDIEIAELRKHEGYEEVMEEPVALVPEKQVTRERKQREPRKVEFPDFMREG